LVPTGASVRANPYFNDWAQWNIFLSQLIKNEDRNKLICKNVIKDLKKGRCILVVSDRVQHCFILENMLVTDFGIAPSSIVVVVGQTIDRKKIYDAVNDGQYDILIASKVIDEGINIQRLDTLHIATPLGSKPRVEQRVGRIRRPKLGKLRPLIYDYLDGGHGQIYGAARSRTKVYYAIGADIENSSGDNLHKGTGLPRYKRS